MRHRCCAQPAQRGSVRNRFLACIRSCAPAPAFRACVRPGPGTELPAANAVDDFRARSGRQGLRIGFSNHAGAVSGRHVTAGTVASGQQPACLIVRCAGCQYDTQAAGLYGFCLAGRGISGIVHCPGCRCPGRSGHRCRIAGRGVGMGGRVRGERPVCHPHAMPGVNMFLSGHPACGGR